VGNLSRDVTEVELQQEFEAFGKVDSVSIVVDKYGGQPRGFGFVEMPAKAEGQAAIEGLNGKGLNEQTLVVNEARPRSWGRIGVVGQMIAEEVGVSVAVGNPEDTNSPWPLYGTSS